MYPSHASLRTSEYTTFRVYVPGHRSRYSFTVSPSGGDVRTRTPEKLPTRDKATYNCPGGPTSQYGRTCTMCQDIRCIHAHGHRGQDTVREDGGREIHAARAQSLPLTLVNGHGETWTYRKLSTLENKRKRLPNMKETGNREESERERERERERES